MERLKGFRDIFPEDAEPRKKIFRVAEEMSEKFDFSKIEFPSVEYLDLYRLKSGEELVGQTFSFVDRGDREVALTPEATPTVVRMLTSRKDLQMPVKWYSFQRYWRYEEPQAGRTREFQQYNADIFGIDSKEADSEVIGLACMILDELGLAGKYVMKLNSREFMETLLHELGVFDLEAAYSSLDKLKKTGRENTIAELEKSGVKKENAERILDLVENGYSPDGFPTESFSFLGNEVKKLERLIETGKLVSLYSKSDVVIDLSIVRGLTYYTGVVFEAYDTTGTFRSILGGGRYDRLASLMSDAEIPAVGFGMGDVIIEMLLKQSGLLQSEKQNRSVFICYSSEESYNILVSIGIELRKQGYRTSLSMSAKSLSSQLRQASKRGFRFAAIVGERELKAGTVTIKDLDSGIQQEVQVKQLSDFDSIFR